MSYGTNPRNGKDMQGRRGEAFRVLFTKENMYFVLFSQPEGSKIGGAQSRLMSSEPTTARQTCLLPVM